MWLRKFKLAVVQREVETIASLIDAVPAFDTKEEAEEAAYLIREALNLMQSLQDENDRNLQQLRKNRKFLEATRGESAKKLDITS